MKNVLSIILLSCLILFSGYVTAQVVVSGVATELEEKVVVKKSRYKFIPKKNAKPVSQLVSFERFDSTGILIEEKDLNNDGSMYAWSFYTYDVNGNITGRTVLNEDSSLMFNQTTTFDNRNRPLLNIGIEPDGNVRFESNYSYNSDSIVGEIWFGDSSKVSTFVSYFDSLDQPVFNKWFDGRGINKSLRSTKEFKYQDSALVKETYMKIFNGECEFGHEIHFDLNGNKLKEFKINSDLTFILDKEYKYDANGNKIMERGYGEYPYSYIWHRKYDSLNEPLSIHKMVDTAVIRNRKSNPLLEKTTFEVLDKYNMRTTIKTTSYYGSISNEVYKIETVSSQFDEQGLWLSTTRTVNGELVEYIYSIYEFQ